MPAPSAPIRAIFPDCEVEIRVIHLVLFLELVYSRIKKWLGDGGIVISAAAILKGITMKYKYATIIGIVLFLAIVGHMIFSANKGVKEATVHLEADDGTHAVPEDHINDEMHKNTAYPGVAQGIHSGEDEGEGHGHENGEGADIIEMTKAQQEECGLVVSIAGPGTIENVLTFVGEIRLNEDRMAHIVPLVPGIVRTVASSLGEKVRAGQELARIVSPELAVLMADYLEKSQNLEFARRTYERKVSLKQENITSEADWLEAQTVFQNAETQLLLAKRKLTALGLSEKEILSLPEAGDDALGRYTITAPISGTIIAKHITLGEKIDGKEVFTIADLSNVWVDLQIPAKDLRHVEKGISVEVTSVEGKSARGRLALIGPTVDEKSRTALARIVLANPDGYWKPGIFINGYILNDTSSAAVVVPANAVQNIEGKDVVFVPSGDGFKPVEVSRGKSSEDNTEILSGLSLGDQYVSVGAFSLKAIKVTSGVDAHAGHGH